MKHIPWQPLRRHFFLLLWNLLASWASLTHAVAQPRVAVLTASPSPGGKYEVLAEAAQRAGFTLEACYLESLDDASLARFARESDLFIVDTPRPGLERAQGTAPAARWRSRRGARHR